MRLISKAEALDELTEDLGKQKSSELLTQLHSNPLPANFSVKADDASNLDSVEAAITPPGPNGKPQPISPIIQDQFNRQEDSKKIEQVTSALKIVLTVITALLIIASLMLVGNTIRLSIYTRRREVEVMRLVGATRWFIRWPFMIEGVVVGFFGGLVAILILWLGKLTIVDPLSNSIGFLAAQNAPRSPSRRWSRSSSPPRCWSPRSAPASPCAASSRSEAFGVRAARTLGLAAAFLAVLAAGLWIGGHPAKMPPSLRDLFVDESAGLTAEATELIEDNYYRPVSQGKLIDSSLQGMVRGLRRRYSDRFSDYFSPQALARFNEEIEGHFSGIGLSVTAVKDGLRVERVFKGSPADAAGIEVGRHDRLGRRAPDRRARLHCRDRPDQRPRRVRGDGRCARHGR